MPVKVNDVIEGVVTGITKFGAFVKLSQNETGLIHISEISHEYVNDVATHLKVGQKVKVKVITVDDKGKISLSIRQLTPKKVVVNKPEELDWKSRDQKKQKNLSFEDMMNLFVKDSNERLSVLAQKKSSKNVTRSKH
jgi:S1 RNA binding domain protein